MKDSWVLVKETQYSVNKDRITLLAMNEGYEYLIYDTRNLGRVGPVFNLQGSTIIPPTFQSREPVLRQELSLRVQWLQVNSESWEVPPNVFPTQLACRFR